MFAIGRTLRIALRDPGVCVVVSVEGVLLSGFGVSKKSNFYQHKTPQRRHRQNELLNYYYFFWGGSRGVFGRRLLQKLFFFEKGKGKGKGEIWRTLLLVFGRRFPFFFFFFLKSEIALKRRGRCDIFERRETI